MKSYIQIVVSILLVIFLAFAIHTYSSKSEKNTKDLRDIQLIVADTSETRQKGLGGRENLPDDTAMLFVFEKPDAYSFWMKDMKFAIDIIWINEVGRIVYMENNVSPNTYPKSFRPDSKSLYVLEGNEDFIEENQLAVGNILLLNMK